MAQIILDSNSNLIQGDFDTATLSQRTRMQTSTVNATTGVYVVPNGSATSASVQVSNAADPTNASKVVVATNGSTDTQIVSGANGTGTYLPLSFYTNNDIRFQINNSGALGVRTGAGTVGFGTSGQVLTSAGSGASPTWTASSGGFRTRVLQSGTTYTPNAQVKSFYVFVYGATGGNTKGGNTGGGGGSGYSEKYYTSPSGSYSYSIGAAGTTSGTAGGTTTFDTISITGSAGASTSTGGAGGVGSGGTFNATGGTGGNGNGGGGGGGGAATRAGNGGNGANGTSGTAAGGGGGGTGGNNASGTTGGSAATTASGSALDLSTTLNPQIQTWDSGGNGTTVGNFTGGNGANATQNQDIVFIWDNTAPTGGRSGSGNATTAVSGSAGVIMIIELL